MTVQLYEGCWGVTRGGPGEPQTVVWPITHSLHDGFPHHPFVSHGRRYTANGTRAYDYTTADIIAVFTSEAEANAYLAGEPAEADCPDCDLPKPSSNPYCFCKPDPRRNAMSMPPAPKPVTWPDGVTEMLMDHDVAVSVCRGFVDTINVDAVSFTPDQARQLAALLLAAADKVEGRG
jgi:hypothetical protein